MIKRVSQIRNFGVFKNYKRTGNIQDFKKVSIIYGWNYSGKTTLSRVFQCIEKEELNKNHPNGRFELVDYDDNKINETNLNFPSKEIRVFNTDFIQNNLSWNGEAFDPILLLGEESIEAKENIEKKKQQVIKIETFIERLRTVYEELENKIESGLTKKAKEITTALGLVESFTKIHLRSIFNTVKTNHTSHKLDDKTKENLLKDAKASDDDKLPKLNEYNITLSLSSHIENIKKLVQEVPKLSTTIDYLAQNPEVANWVEKGVSIHGNKSTCKYCGNTIPEKRKEKLLAHFSKDLKNHKQKLNQLQQNIDSAELHASQINSRDFYPPFRNEFDSTFENLNKEIKAYNTQLEQLSKLLKTKKNKPFEKIINFPKFEDCSESLEQTVKEYNALVKKNNEHTNKFEENKSTAIAKLKKHYAAVFIHEINLFKKDKKIKTYKAREQTLINSKDEINRDILALEAQISKAQKGREKLNEYVKNFLGREEIRVEVIKEAENERFTLKRNDQKALNLSEGEKTAIAFSFFLVKLLGIEDFENTIVFIDDPISSLDSNHIFQVNAFLKDFFFLKKDDNSSWELTCNQLFISTHNFDFFSLLRELPKKGRPKDHQDLQHSFYYVKRVNNNEAQIGKLPKAIEKYTSEYHYLFKEIYDFHNSNDKSDYEALMNLPNAVRRFVELYTYSRLPGNKSSTVDQRADKLWDKERSKRILKVFHYFSHSNNIDRILKNSDLLCNIENAVDDLITELKKDQHHYEELVKAVNN